VLLTGSLDDGTAGLRVVKQLGGVAIVQDPADALFPSMPASALRHVAVDHCVPLPEIAPLLVRLAATPVAERGRAPVPVEVKVEVDIAKEENAVDAGVEQIGEPSSFACPECHGVLLRMKGEHPPRFRCHTGHAYSAQSLVAAAGEEVEQALWTAVRSLEEARLLLKHLATHSRDEGDTARAEALEADGDEAGRQAEAVRMVVTARAALPAVKS
jgi:two-component system chemotaxis response regulator CheB